jgi:heterodisulfide reductase subunit C
MTYEEKSVSSKFSDEIRHRLGGETIAFCYQCGTCASSCPVAKVTDKYNPREIIKLSLLGARKEIVAGDTIWLCCSCYNCQERCPQEVEIADVIYTLRNIAIQEGNVPDIYVAFAEGISNEGRIVPVSKFAEKKREEYGLPPIKPANMDALRKILQATSFSKIQFKKGEAQ